MREFLHARPELELVEPRGGTVVFPRLRGVADSSRFAERLLHERETAIVPGRFFEAPAHFRVGSAARPARSAAVSSPRRGARREGVVGPNP